MNVLGTVPSSLSLLRNFAKILTAIIELQVSDFSSSQLTEDHFREYPWSSFLIHGKRVDIMEMAANWVCESLMFS